MRGIILAAGRGVRLESVIANKPKCLIPFDGRPLIDYQLAAFNAVGINEFVLVVGYEKEQIQEHLRDSPFHITYVENTRYAETNTLYSLWMAREHFDEDFLYANADVLFDQRLTKRLVHETHHAAFGCNSSKCAEEEVKVIVDETRITTIGKELDPDECYGEFVGVAKFTRDVNQRFAEILDQCIADRSLWNSYFEYAVNLLAKEIELHCVDISDVPAIEIDFPEDYRHAQEEILPRLRVSSLEEIIPPLRRVGNL